MQAEKIMLETDPGGRLIGLPKLQGNRRVEAIFLILDGKTDAPVKRQPHPDLSGRVKIQGAERAVPCLNIIPDSLLLDYMLIATKGIERHGFHPRGQRVPLIAGVNHHYLLQI